MPASTTDDNNDPHNQAASPPEEELQSFPRRRLEVDDVTVVDKKTFRTAIGGTVVGNLMEWYDVGVYGYLAVTIGALFMPESVPDVAKNLFSLGVFAVTFVARPLGGTVLGQLGDRLGRQKVLAFTLIMMALSTALIGMLPTFAAIGFVAPTALIILKLAQGFSTGGEYAGASTFITEYAPDKKRGFYASFLDMGSYLGFAIGAAFVSVLQLTLADAAMTSYGWRIPFLVAIPFGAVAIYFRMRVEDTPAFRDVQERAAEENKKAMAEDDAPKGVIGLLKAFWPQMLTAFVLASTSGTTAYALTSYMPTYLTSTLGYDAVHGNLLTLPVLLIMSGSIPFIGMLSDRIGRRPVLIIGSAAGVVLVIPAFLLMMHGQVWSTLAGLFLLAIPVACYVSNLASSLPALFPTASRYGAMGISYNLALAIFGGTAPFIMEGLLVATKGFTSQTINDLAPALWVIVMSLAGLIAALHLRESANRPLPGETPSVSTDEEAYHLVANQYQDEHFNPAEVFGEPARLEGPYIEEDYEQLQRIEKAEREAYASKAWENPAEAAEDSKGTSSDEDPEAQPV